MMLNSHIAQQHNAALEREALMAAARARMVAKVRHVWFARARGPREPLRLSASQPKPSATATL